MVLVHGKSTACQILKEKYNALLISADEISKKLTTSPYVMDLLVDAFGESILQHEHIDSKVLSTIVFNDKNKLKILNNIMHPLIMNEIKKQISNSTCNFILLDVPLPIQEFIDMCNIIITITSPLSTRIERIMKRSNLSYEDALSRINNQLSDDEYKKIADFVICNNGNFDELKEKIDGLII